MKIVKIDQKNWVEGLKLFYGSYRLFGPVREGQTNKFRELEEGESPDLTIPNTHLSAKSVVYPQSQKMFTYGLDENEQDHHLLKPADSESKPRIVFAVRPCDAAAFKIAQKNFDSPDYRDPFWCDAYENTLLVGLACRSPGQTCFCTSTGIGPFSEKGMDILMAEDGNDLLLKAVTDKGLELLDQAGWSTEGDTETFKALAEAAQQKITAVLDTDQISKSSSKQLFDAPFWDDVAFACINCGTCTFSCPTCWCFDIQDENQGTGGQRMRNWDSCMSPLFTLEGSGHNPRGVKFQRVRQRFMHKLKYYNDKYQDGVQCVGCGRCIQLCPVNIDIRAVCQKMNQYSNKTA